MASPLFQRLDKFRDSVLLRDAHGAYTGADLLAAASAAAAQLGEEPFDGKHIALLASPGLPYVAGMLATWMRGAAVVPLCPDHPPAEMEYMICDSEAVAVLADAALVNRLPEIPVPVMALSTETKTIIPVTVPKIDLERDALLLYTSGTTGKPKGAVHTHRGLQAQITCLVEAWEWSAKDVIPHFLPLHHTHGIINKLLCPLWAGARCDMLPGFQALPVWERLAAGDYTIFMAVPTVYAKLISAWEEASTDQQAKWSAACANLRLMVSGSAALPVSVLEKWKTISGHVLLERYGMTEIGMALSNPLHGERRPGFVGQPLPGVDVRLVDENGEPLSGETTGELEVRGANLFRCYWNRPEETEKAFHGNWFRTGDAVAFENGAYKIVGRLSTDIIKTGGYKVSAIEIENVLLQHPAVRECAVVAVPDETWGERVAAVLVLRENQSLTLEVLREFAKVELASYKLPSLLFLRDQLPRNAMGKVMKKGILDIFH